MKWSSAPPRTKSWFRHYYIGALEIVKYTIILIIEVLIFILKSESLKLNADIDQSILVTNLYHTCILRWIL